MRFTGMIAGCPCRFAGCECLCLGLGAVAWGAECLEVYGVVCAALGEVDDVVYLGGGVAACAAGVPVTG